MLRKCRGCGLEAHTPDDLENFKQSPRAPHGRTTQCKKCYNDQVREGNRKRQYKARYGTTPEEYERCMATSDCCQICGDTEDLVYDHCHNSMAFRGVLCRNHNAAIGLLGDTAEDALRAYEYLKEAESANK